MNLNLTDLFMIEPMHGGSVNGWIYIPPSFTIMIYCVIISITTVIAVFFIMKKTSLVQAYRKSIVIAFFCAGFLYLVYSERTWYTWVREDLNTYSGYSTEAKTGIFLGSLYDFIRVTREVLLPWLH
jgi:prolipoprotein diacylglyceryltransferase